MTRCLECGTEVDGCCPECSSDASDANTAARGGGKARIVLEFDRRNVTIILTLVIVVMMAAIFFCPWYLYQHEIKYDPTFRDEGRTHHLTISYDLLEAERNDVVEDADGAVEYSTTDIWDNSELLANKQVLGEVQEQTLALFALSFVLMVLFAFLFFKAPDHKMTKMALLAATIALFVCVAWFSLFWRSTPAPSQLNYGVDYSGTWLHKRFFVQGDIIGEGVKRVASGYALAVASVILCLINIKLLFSKSGDAPPSREG
ncbi:MAG: hypothetical protein KAT70_06180 [Thermoplasmata archaeon]|nr:hypothetical protein [Thermoplasmata archaeon]